MPTNLGLGVDCINRSYTCQVVTPAPPQPERYAEVVQAAIRAFARKGYGGTTLADIAVEAGVSQPRISQIFGNKENAFIEAHKVASKEVLSLLAANAEPPFSIERMGAGYVQLMQERREVLLMIFQALTSSYVPSIGDEARRVINEVTTLVVDQAGGTHEDAVAFLERGFFIHAMMAARVFDHVGDYPETGKLLDTVRIS